MDAKIILPANPPGTDLNVGSQSRDRNGGTRLER